MASRPATNENGMTTSMNEFIRDLNRQDTTDLSLHASDDSYRTRPMFAVKVSKQQLQLLTHRVKNDLHSQRIHAPKVALFNGQVAAITDQNHRPFVTAVKPSETDDGLLPVIETVTCGWQIDVFAEASEDDIVNLRCVLTESEIKGVEQANVPFLDKAAVQVPIVAKTSASSGAHLAQGESLLIMSPETYDPDAESPENPRARFYVLTPKVIVQETIIDGRS